MTGAARKFGSYANEIFVNDLHQLHRSISVDVFSQVTQRKAILEEIENRDDFVYGQSISMIMLFGPAIKSVIRFHYFEDQADAILTTRQINANKETIADLFLETANLYVGALSEFFTGKNITNSVSLPVITDGFDEVYLSDVWHPSEVRDYWKLKMDENYIICTVTNEIRDVEQLRNLNFSRTKSIENESGVLFI